jgi:hypothetical protein
VPVGYDSHKQGRLACFRQVADLTEEAKQRAQQEGTDMGSVAVAAVIRRERSCPLWSKYMPGIAPREHFAEARAQAFEKQLSRGATRVAVWVAIAGAVIGLLQLLAISPDSVGCQLLKNSVSWLGLLSWLHCR